MNHLLNGIIRFALHQRAMVAAVAIFLVVYGSWQASQLPIDVFPALDRPRVTIMTEAPGLAPEEVEAMITFPLESVINGATGVQAVRTQSGTSLSIVHVEFGWNTDIYVGRQIVNERLALAAERLPANVTPQLAPVSSILGQIMIIGMWSEGGRTDTLQLRTLADWVVRQRLLTIPGVSQVFVMGGDRMQFQVLVDPNALVRYGVTLAEVEKALAESNQNATGGYLDQQGPNEYLVRAIGRIENIQQVRDIVVATRDGRPVTINDVAARVIEGPETKRGDAAAYRRQADGKFTGGPAVILTINKQPNADTRRITQLVTEALAELHDSLPADVRIAPEMYQQRGFIDRAVNNVVEALRDGGLLVVIILFLVLLNFRTTFITLTAIPLSIVITAIVFSIFKLSINTMTLGGLAVAIGELVDDAVVDVENIFRRLKENRHSAQPKPGLLVVFQASAEIRNSIVFSTITVVLAFTPVFALSGMEGRLFGPVGVAYIVSIVASLLVSLTLTPVLSYWLLARRGIWPWVAAAVALGIGLAAVYFIVPPLLSRLGLSMITAWWQTQPTWLHWAAAALLAPPIWAVMLWADRYSEEEREGFVLKGLKALAGQAIAIGLRAPLAVLTVAAGCVAVAVFALGRLESDFLPPFNEGTLQVNVIMPPGTSLQVSSNAAEMAARRLQGVDDVMAFVRKTGRAELDEHAVPVSATEIVAVLDPRSGKSREQLIEEVREAMADIPGIVVAVEQPLAHFISAMLSGVQAQVAIKLYGDDLDLMRRKAKEMEQAIGGVAGVKDLQVEPQVEIPQIQIRLDGHQLKKYGLRRADVNRFIETAMNGHVVSEVLVGQRTFDLLVRFDKPFREDIDAVERLAIELPGGGTTSLGTVATIDRDATGPNTINREEVRRRIVIQCNTAGRGLVDVVSDIKAKVAPISASLPTGYFIEYGGQFESQQSASRVIAIAFVGAVIGIFLVLYAMFRSANLAIQVMVALPMAFIGSVAALYVTQQTLTVAAMIGFISLCGIATRNGILLINHYLHLVQHEGEDWTPAMILRAGRERVAPVLMTAATAGIGLAPLAMAAGEPGKEILYPVATVIIGGLITSTVLEFFVRPAMFWLFGIRSAQRVIELGREEVVLEEREAIAFAREPE